MSGAAGFIGRHLVPRLSGAGDEVVPLRRGAAAGGDPWRWPEGQAPFDAVVHLAALNPERRDPASRDAGALECANVEGTRSLAALAAARGAGRFVFLSTASLHAMQGATPIRESDAPNPQSAYAASKLAAEAALRDVAASTGLEAVVLRPPPVYGAGGRGAIAALRRLAASPLPLPLGDLRRRRSLLAVENAVDAIALALRHPAAGGGAFLLADDDPLSIGEIVALMRARTGRRARVLPLPDRLAEFAARALGREDTVRRLLGPFVLDDSHIRDRLGWRPKLATREALR